MVNPFDDPDGDFMVLVNAEDQHSLWPAAIAVPDGWTMVHGPVRRDGCLEYVRVHWTDMRPLSLRRLTASPAPAEVTR